MAPDGRVPTQSVAGSSRGVGMVALVIAGVLLLAVLKPWEGPPSVPAPPPSAAAAVPDVATAPSTRPHPTAAPANALPTEDPLVREARARRQCQSPEEWRIVTMQAAYARQTRTLFAVRPARASGPDDPTIEPHPLWASQLLGLGVCVPRKDQSDANATLRRVVIWQLRPDGSAVRLRALSPLDAGLYSLGEAYFGPPGSAGRAAAWPVGRYVFEIRPDGKAHEHLWFALDFVGDGQHRGGRSG